MKKLSILIFNWRCWLNPASGGAEVFTRENASRWARAGHKVTLFTSEYEGAKKEETIDGVKIIRSGGKYSVYRRASEFYRSQFTKGNFDVIIDEINTRPFLTPKFVNKEGRIVALIFQLAKEYWFYETPFPISYIGYHLLEARWLRGYINIPTVTISESSKRDLIDLGFKKVFIVPVGVNFSPLEVIPEKKEYPVIAYVGRLTRAKRPDHVIKAFKNIREKLPNVQLWVIGQGYYKSHLKAIACEGVKFFDDLSNEKRRELLKKAWVLVNPSVREGFGLNIIEANALGTACVAYDVAGLRDAIKSDETGMLAEAGNIKDLTKKVFTVIMDGSLRERLSRNALSYSRQFSWDKSAENFLKVIVHEVQDCIR